MHRPLAWLVPLLVGHAAALQPRLVHRRSGIIRASLDDSEDVDLARAFAAERRRRAEGASSPPPSPRREQGFTGIREVVLNEQGRPVSISRRDPPRPGTSVRDELSDLTTQPAFLLGVLAAIGTIALLVTIAAADSAASS